MIYRDECVCVCVRSSHMIYHYSPICLSERIYELGVDDDKLIRADNVIYLSSRRFFLPGQYTSYRRSHITTIQGNVECVTSTLEFLSSVIL